MGKLILLIVTTKWKYRASYRHWYYVVSQLPQAMARKQEVPIVIYSHCCKIKNELSAEMNSKTRASNKAIGLVCE